MARIADHLPANARQLLSLDADKTSRDAAPAPPAVLKCRPPPSRRAPQTTMPFHICLRLAGLWLAALGGLVALVLTIRGHA